MLNCNLRTNYLPVPNSTLFTQYIPSAKFGIKVWWVRDFVLSYPMKGQIYTGLAASSETGKKRRREGTEGLVRKSYSLK